MKPFPQMLAVLGAAALVGCAPSDNAPQLAPKVDGERHPDKRLYVQYGAQKYFVDVRYVDLINESVIAVRDRGGKSDGREAITVPATVGVPVGEPFASNSFKPLAISIAKHIRNMSKICDGGRQMALRINRDGETRVTYRSGRGAWVIFAACPAATTG